MPIVLMVFTHGIVDAARAADIGQSEERGYQTFG